MRECLGRSVGEATIRRRPRGGVPRRRWNLERARERSATMGDDLQQHKRPTTYLLLSVRLPINDHAIPNRSIAGRRMRGVGR